MCSYVSEQNNNTNKQEFLPDVLVKYRQFIEEEIDARVLHIDRVSPPLVEYLLQRYCFTVGLGCMFGLYMGVRIYLRHV